MEVKCPRCRKLTVYDSTNPHRPFCSERCQTLDLGAWADEEYRVPDVKSDADGVNDNSDDETSSDPERPPKHRLN